MAKYLQYLGLVAGSLVVAFVALEVTSRLVSPLSPGARYVALDGQSFEFESDNPFRLPAGITFRQVSSEYDALTTLTSLGHRVPKVKGNPKVIFLGDSFTFGTGLSDEETFVWIYCTKAGMSCANLGQIGTGTGAQLDILDHYLNYEGWRPDEVKLFMVAMSSALMAGNDFLDNLRYLPGSGRTTRATVASDDGRGSLHFLGYIVGLRKSLLRHSNLARQAYFQFAPLLRTALSPSPDRTVLKEALENTRVYLQRLEKLGDKYGFTYTIYVLHPVQDILRGTHELTVDTVRALAPGMAVVGTAPLFLDDPVRFYYSFDGHLNPNGSDAVANLLFRETQDQRNK